MKEYIKKFKSATTANNYPITDIPFTTSIASNPVQNLVCNESGKKLVNVSGTIQIQSAGPELISFTINGDTYHAEEEMTWGEWCAEPKYNTIGAWINTWALIRRVEEIPTIDVNGSHEAIVTDDANPGPNSVIINNYAYWTTVDPLGPRKVL